MSFNQKPSEPISVYEDKYRLAKRKLKEIQEKYDDSQSKLQQAKNLINRLKQRNSLLEAEILKLDDDSPTTSESEEEKPTFDIKAKVKTSSPYGVNNNQIRNGSSNRSGSSYNGVTSALTSKDKGNKSSRRNVSKARRVQPLPRDDLGNYILPVTVGILTVVSLGRVEYKNPSFHNERYIWPIGYTVKRYYNSTVSPDREACYTATILEVNGNPRFQIDADDCPEPFIAESPTGVWTAVMRKANKLRSKGATNSASGPDYYGFSHPTIAKMIQDLENADKCSRYTMQEFEMMDPRYVPTRKWNTPPVNPLEIRGTGLKDRGVILGHSNDYRPSVPSRLAVETTNMISAEEADRLLSQSDSSDHGKGGIVNSSSGSL